MKDSKKEARLTRPSKEGTDREVNQKANLRFTLSENPKKSKGKMLLGGSLAIVNPELHPIALRFEKEGMEFDLHQKPGEKDEFEFDVWANLENCDVTIETEFKDGEGPHETLYLEITDPGERKVCLTITTDQARVIQNILERYLECYYAFHALAEIKTVKA